MEKIDARGMECPAPVIELKKRIEEKHPQALQIIVDNDAARQNVTRFFESQHYTAESRTAGNDFYVTGKTGQVSDQTASDPEPQTAENGPQKIMIMIASDQIGSGDDELGKKLMINFIKTLKEMGSRLFRLVFVNNGVKLTVTGSEALSDLKELEANNVSILVCGTCLNHFDLLEKKEAGETTNMLDIVTSMQVADKVINI